MRTRLAVKRHVSGPFVPRRQLIFCHFSPTNIVSAETGDISGIWCLSGLRAFLRRKDHGDIARIDFLAPRHTNCPQEATFAQSMTERRARSVSRVRQHTAEA